MRLSSVDRRTGRTAASLRERMVGTRSAFLRHMHALLRPLPMAFAVTIAACSSQGQLGQAELAPDCTANDEICESGPLRPLAVGARQLLTVRPLQPDPGGQTPAIHFVSANSDVAVIDDGGVLATGDGVTAILLVAADDSVLDFTHVAAASAVRLGLHPGYGDVATRALSGTVPVAPGATFTMTVAPHSDTQVLGGTFDIAVDSSNRTFSAVPTGDPAIFSFVAPGWGWTAIDVTALGLSAAVTLEVAP